MIVSDIRRKTDIQFFNDNKYNILTIRIQASDDTRIQRGWKFVAGIDDVPSECDLDDYDKWDYHISNDANDDNEIFLNKLIDIVRKAIE